MGHGPETRPVAIGPVLARVAAILKLPVRRGRLGPGNEIHEWPQVSRGDLHDVIALLAQRLGDCPVAGRHDVDDGHPHPEILHLGDDLGEVLLGADDDRVADRMVPGQRGQVALHLGFHALAPSRAHPAEPQLEPGEIGQRLMFGIALSLDDRLIPVTPQHGQAGAVPAEPGEKLDQARVIPGNGAALAGPVNRHGAVSEHIARIHEQRTPIHAIPLLPLDARRYQRIATVVT